MILPSKELELSQTSLPQAVEPPSPSQLSWKSKPPMTYEEKKNIVIFLTIFIMLGIPMGLQSSIMLLLADNQANKAQLAIFSICQYPFAFKILIAPFLDSFYLNEFGKRRTYLVPCLYMLGLTLLVLGYEQYTDWISEFKITYLVTLCFFSSLLTAVAFIAVHGWISSSFTKHYVHLGATCQLIGTALGTIIGYTVMLNLTSQYFCQTYLGRGPLFSINHFTMISGVCLFMITILIQLFTAEPLELHQQPAMEKFKQVVKQIYSMSNNKNLQFLLLFLLTRKFGFSPVFASIGINLVQLGFPSASYASMAIFMYPSIIVSSILVGRYLARGYEFTWILYAYAGNFLVTALYFLYIQNFISLGGYNNTTYALLVKYIQFQFVVMTIHEVIHTFEACSLIGFFMRICDIRIGGSYLTLLSCCSNLGHQIASSVALFLMNYISFKIVVVFGWIYAIVYLIVTKDKLLSLQYLDLESWQVAESEEDE